MTSRNVQYTLSAQSSLAQTIKADSDAMRGLASSAALTHKELVAGMNASTRAAAELRRELGQTTQGHQSMSGAMGGGLPIMGLAAGALLAVGAAAVGVGASLVSNAATMEQSRVGFTQLAGSVAGADAELKELAAFAAKTPFNAADVRAYAQAFQAMGIAQKDVIPDLTALGNAVSAMGKGKNELQSAALAWEQVHAKGKLAGQEILQFTNAGIPVLKILSEQLGITKGEVSKLSEAGAISAQIWEEAFRAYSSQNWGGAMEAQSHTLNGLISNIQDLGEQFATALGGPIIAVAEQELARLVDDLSKPEVGATLADWGDKLGRLTQLAFSAWDTFAAGARIALDAVRPITDAIGQLIGTLPALNTATSNPIAPLAASTTDLNTQIGLSITKTNDYKEEIAAAQDQLTAMRRTQQDASFATDQQIQQERTKLSVLEAQWAVQDRATGIARLQQKIKRDEALAKNLYSGPGQAAGARLVEERQQLQDMLTAQGREGAKGEIQSHIDSLTERKKADDQAARLQERAQQDYIDGLHRRAEADKKAADAAAAADTLRQKAAADLALAQDKLFSQLQTLDYGMTTQTTTTQGTTGALFQLSDQVRELFRDAGSLADQFKTALGPAFMDATNAAKDFLTAGNNIAILFGNKGGMGDILAKNAQAGLGALSAILRETEQGFKRLALAAAVAKDLTGGGDGSAVRSAYEAFAKNDIFTQAGRAVGNQLDQFLGTTANPTTSASKRYQSQYDYSSNQSEGGVDTSQLPENFPRRAGGGPVSGGAGYLVGERGPELFVPHQNGAIMPTGSFGGGAQITVQTVCIECQRAQVANVIRQSGQLIVEVAGKHVRGSRHQ